MITAPFLAFAIAAIVSGCGGDQYKVSDDRNIPVGTAISPRGGFRVPDGATDPLSRILLDATIANGSEISVGETRYKKLRKGVGKHL